ncbi:Clp amino terminal domain-containing protein, pathogenicity island component [Lentzea albidocapillata subsp. violacea]|uniref:Clp amino terminal domain-containing protein, pathogenicity island component n=1 Tax=Lentzea albidocapillata subsp. violacea TaxID=128104 RepID=A0A1G8V6U2_9PSEU|nr:Clp protease N-terminal domain-containing protein [Lentzea albidocapillata]SDJ61055.1 Clp amino terminal domain-containing protein, pathogenicity island component [Lentzea albidocapillata subsp. violacea]
MPKINVYLPDELAESVKDMNIPVSAICQRALEGSVKRIIAIRALTVDDLRRDSFPHFTDRAWKALQIAAECSQGTKIGTSHLLNGIVSEGGNLALDVLRAIDITPDGLPSFIPADIGRKPGFADDGAAALELAVTESIALGHNYVGCEHLLLGIVAEPNGKGGEELRELGAEIKGTRRAVQTALAGIVHLKKQQKAAPDAAKVLEMIMSRLARLEQHAGIG